MASDRERNIGDMLVRSVAFDDAHKLEFAAITEAAAQAARFKAASDAIQAALAIQISGDSEMATEAKGVLRLAVKRHMKTLTRTGKQVAKKVPGLEKVMTMPTSDSDSDLLAKGEALIANTTENQTEFTKLGFAPAKVTDFSALLTQFANADTAQAASAGARVGATADVGNQCEIGVDAVEIYDAIMQIFYENDPATLAEWNTARHIKRAPKSKTTDVPGGGGGGPVPVPPTP